MNQVTRRVLYTAIPVVIVVVAVIFFWSQSTNMSTVSDIEPTTDTTFQIKDLEQYSKDLDAPLRESITSSIEKYAKEGSDKSAKLSGVIRDSSYKKATPSSGVQTITFLVDLESVKRTYKVDYARDSSTGENSLYILCPEKSELIYPAFTCKDDLSGS